MAGWKGRVPIALLLLVSCSGSADLAPAATPGAEPHELASLTPEEIMESRTLLLKTSAEPCRLERAPNGLLRGDCASIPVFPDSWGVVEGAYAFLRFPEARDGRVSVRVERVTDGGGITATLTADRVGDCEAPGQDVLCDTLWTEEAAVDPEAFTVDPEEGTAAFRWPLRDAAVDARCQAVSDRLTISVAPEAGHLLVARRDTECAASFGRYAWGESGGFDAATGGMFLRIPYPQP